MDVHCERCQTEYELEDSSVSDAGTQVQCSACGYMFLVRRPGPGAIPAQSQPRSTSAGMGPPPGPPPAPDAEGPPPAAEWLLETSEGQVHRFRNLTSLQKWIIERKITRNDKISRTGQ